MSLSRPSRENKTTFNVQVEIFVILFFPFNLYKTIWKLIIQVCTREHHLYLISGETDREMEMISAMKKDEIFAYAVRNKILFCYQKSFAGLFE